MRLLKAAPIAPISINTAKPTAKNVGANVYKATIVGKIIKSQRKVFLASPFLKNSKTIYAAKKRG
ncbi:hypothetical protein [Campylobacter sp.]|uniref:hypothetical protein n=1 Tax=Campylobacter sp. TaxID=205 RepID=UPI002A81EADD|nr:hypothetical protein [Campylobacter sp.]MDY4154641.1 hypothetical protein [Campylobacter sp.]